MARHVPSQAGNETCEAFDTHHAFVRLLSFMYHDQYSCKGSGLLGAQAI